MVHKIPEQYDLAIGYTWYNNATIGISGHMFEMIEYYYILSKHIKTCMLICEKVSYDVIEQVIRDKYDFSEEEIQSMLSDIIYFDSPRIVKGKNLLLVDGNFDGMANKVIVFDNVMCFPCSNLTFQKKDWVIALQDDRIYGKGNNTVNYVKKILFDRYKKVSESGDRYLLYATKNTKKITEKFYKELEQSFDGDFFVATNEDLELSERFEVGQVPVDDIWSKFHTYIYTPTLPKKDCSPRFIAECKYYGRDVEYFKIDYMDRDLGLCFRRYDIENDFDSLYLREDDPIIDIVKGII